MNDLASLVGTRWVHVKSGGKYQITGLALREINMEEHILYRKLKDDGLFDTHTWARPATEFLDGRFKRIKGS
jgi:hypothetical protein